MIQVGWNPHPNRRNPTPAHHCVGLRLQHPQEDLVEGRPKKMNIQLHQKWRPCFKAVRCLSCMQLIVTSNTPQFAPWPIRTRSCQRKKLGKHWFGVTPTLRTLGMRVGNRNFRQVLGANHWEHQLDIKFCMLLLSDLSRAAGSIRHDVLKSEPWMTTVHVSDVGQWRDVSRI